MLYRKPLKLKKEIDKRIALTNFSGGINTQTDELILPQTSATLCYNLSGKSGALVEHLGISSFMHNDVEVVMPNNISIIKLWYYKRTDISQLSDNRIVILGSDMQLYSLSLSISSAIELIGGIVFSSIPVVANYKLNDQDVLILSSKTDSMVVYNGIDPPYFVASAPKLTSMCVHYERLFATVDNSNTLWFSDDLDPTNWNIALDQAGYIEMADEKGSLLRVISFHDYVYVFREYGIARVSAYSDQAQFSVSQLFSTGGRIYSDTVAVCGDRIMFLSDDGLYSFDGITATKVLTNLYEYYSGIDNAYACGCYYLGIYYLALRCDFSDDESILCEQGNYRNNTLMEINLNDGSVSLLRGVDVCCLLALQSAQYNKLLLVSRSQKNKNIAYLDNSGMVFDEILPKMWQCPKTALGVIDRRKRLKEIYIFSKGDATIEVEADKHRHFYHIRGSERVIRVMIGIGGNVFRIRFRSSCKEINISQPLLVFNVS